MVFGALGTFGNGYMVTSFKTTASRLGSKGALLERIS